MIVVSFIPSPDRGHVLRTGYVLSLFQNENVQAGEYGVVNEHTLHTPPTPCTFSYI